MKIEKLRAVNVKRLVDVEMVPGDASLVVVAGNNGQGKTSVLDSIWMALGGASAVPERPIRDGEESAEVELDLGSWIVTRRWARNGPGELTVRNKDGDSKSRPQSFLDGLVGSLSFDPLTFSRMSPREQTGYLRELVGLDTAQLDAVHARVYEERRAENRELKTLEARLAAVPEVEAPDETVSVAGLTEKLRAAMEHNAKREELLHAADRAKRDRDNWLGAIERLREELKNAERKLSDLQNILDDAFTAAENAPQAIGIGDIQEQIADAEKTNERVRAKRTRAGLVAQVEAARKESERLSAELAQVEADKAALLAAAQFPVPGLSIDGDTITYQGIPFAQASASEQLRVSLAMGIAMNPTLRVMLIRDGSLLDSQSLLVVDEMATKAGVQVWLERVGTDGPVTFVIEEGKIRAAMVADPVSEEEREALIEEDPEGDPASIGPVTSPEVIAGMDGDR